MLRFMNNLKQQLIQPMLGKMGATQLLTIWVIL